MSDNQQTQDASVDPQAAAGSSLVHCKVDPFRRELASTFNEDAELYDRSRPRYTPALFHDLATLAGLGPDSRVLEIGCATGQATVPLAKLGCSILAVELGDNLAEVARRNLSKFPKATVIVSPFEDWPLPAEPFDLVVAATSFHFINENIRTPKAADALREGGSLAVISTTHIRGGTQDFFDDVDRVYKRLKLGPPEYVCPAASDIPQIPTEFEKSKRFGPVTFHRHEWEVTYTTQQYLDVIATYSSHRILSRDVAAELESFLVALLNGKYGGRIVKRYMAQIAIARKQD